MAYWQWRSQHRFVNYPASLYCSRTSAKRMVFARLSVQQRMEFGNDRSSATFSASPENWKFAGWLLLAFSDVNTVSHTEQKWLRQNSTVQSDSVDHGCQRWLESTHGVCVGGRASGTGDLSGWLKFTHDRCVTHQFSGQVSRSNDVTGYPEYLQSCWTEQAILLAKRANLLLAVHKKILKNRWTFFSYNLLPYLCSSWHCLVQGGPKKLDFLLSCNFLNR